MLQIIYLMKTVLSPICFIIILLLKNGFIPERIFQVYNCSNIDQCYLANTILCQELHTVLTSRNMRNCHNIFMTVWHECKTIWWMNAVGHKNKGTRLFTRERRLHCTFVLKTRPFPELSKTRKTLGETSWFSQPHLPAPPTLRNIFCTPNSPLDRPRACCEHLTAVKTTTTPGMLPVKITSTRFCTPLGISIHCFTAVTRSARYYPPHLSPLSYTPLIHSFDREPWPTRLNIQS